MPRIGETVLLMLSTPPSSTTPFGGLIDTNEYRGIITFPHDAKVDAPALTIRDGEALESPKHFIRWVEGVLVRKSLAKKGA